MQKVSLKVYRREKVGKEGAKKVRREGFVPAVIYSPNIQPTPIKVEPKVIKESLIKYGVNTLFSLESEEIPELNGKMAIVKEIQRHPISREYLHVDLYEVDVNKKVYVEVPVEVVGKAVGVEKGGMLEVLMRTIEVKCLPLSIPDSIKIDVTSLDLGGVIHIEDIEFPEGVEPVEDPKEPVITVLAPEGEEEGEEGEEGEESGGE